MHQRIDFFVSGKLFFSHCYFFRSRSRDRGADRGRWQLVQWPSAGEAAGIVAERWGGCRRHGRAMGRAAVVDAGERPVRQDRAVLLLVRSMARFHEMAPDLLEDIHDDCS